MKKNKLIELLQSIEGNPDIVLWNGYVQDYNDINTEFEEVELVKETVDFMYENYVWAFMQEHKILDINEVPDSVKEACLKRAKQRHRTAQWEFPNEFVTEEERERWYGKRTKRAVMLNIKLRDKVSLGICSSDDVCY